MSRWRGFVYAVLVLVSVMVATPLRAAIPAAERTALINLYNSTNGAQWRNASGWNSTAGSECFWFGVTCDSSQSTVLNLSLVQNNLQGSLTPLTALTNLQLFDATQNELTGSIPPLTGLSNLQVFNVSNNQLTGSLPSLAGLTALSQFRVESNQLTGSIPSLSDATGLTYFNAQYNQLTGSIPPIAELSSLVVFIVSTNQLSGPMPSIAGLINLQQFDVGFNRLTGSVPALTNLPSLQSFYIEQNNLSGTLPSPPPGLGSAMLCPNALLNQVANTGWDTATGKSPWYQNCGGPAQLAILSVNNGVSPTVGSKFDVIVQSQNTNGQPVNLAAYTTIQLALVQGSGELYSQSSAQCTIPAGGSTCTVSDVAYSTVDSGVTLQANTCYYCGQNSLAAPPSAPFSVVAGTFTIGGTVSGLVGSGLVVSLVPGGENLSISANGNFSWPVLVGDGTYYSVNVVSQPTSPAQQCGVNAGYGNVSGGNVTSIQIVCVTLRTVTMIVGPNGTASPSQTTTSGNAVSIYAYGYSGFYSELSASGCTLTKTSSTYWTTNPLYGDCTVTATFLPIQFIAVTPARLLDTRPGGTTIDGAFAGIGAMTAHVPLAFTVLGRGGVPASGVSAVVINVTATNTTSPGFLTAWPSCSTRPLASNLNFVGQQTIANLVIVKAGCDLTANLFSSTGPTDAVVDVVGYFNTGTDFTSLVPTRLLDTRSGATTADGLNAGTGAVAGGTQIDLPVAGRAGIPASGASAVAINVTATNPTASGFVTVWPTDQPRPLASNLNFRAGQTVPNLVIAKLSANGKISLFNSAGTTDLIGDVTAWFGASSTLVPLAPARVVDTRTGAHTIDGSYAGGGPVVSGTPLHFQIGGRGGVPSYGVEAVVLNVTVTNPTKAGYLTVWPNGNTQPLASNLNFLPGQTVPNLVVVSIAPYYYFNGDTQLSISAGSGDVVVDLVGWFVGQ